MSLTREEVEKIWGYDGTCLELCRERKSEKKKTGEERGVGMGGEKTGVG